MCRGMCLNSDSRQNSIICCSRSGRAKADRVESLRIDDREDLLEQPLVLRCVTGLIDQRIEAQPRAPTLLL